MSDLSTDLTPADAPEVSTQLDTGKPTTEGTPAKEEAKKPESRLDAIKRAAADVEKSTTVEDKKEDAPKDEGVKDEAAPEKPEAAKEEAPQKEQRDRRQPIEAPANFLPRAKELWANVPHEVRSEFQRVMAEKDQSSNATTESLKEYEAIKPYAEMAKRSGTTIDQALGRYVQMEQTLRSDPVSGFRALGQNMGLSPVQMIGHIMAAHNVRPEQLVQHMAQDPNAYTALAPRQQAPQQQQPNTEIDGLKQQIERMQAEMAQSHVETNIITPFAKENPRYYELEGAIASFLNSDIVPRNLSPQDRLAAAYDMAVRISPSPQRQASVQVEGDENQEDTRRAGNDFGGSKSVRGAPATGVDTSSRKRGKLSRGDAISAAMAELGIAH